MPGYLVSPRSYASGISMSPISGLDSGNVQLAISELFDKYISTELKSVNVYADDDSRAASITSPTEGQITYLLSNKMVEVYSGSSWIPVGSPDDYSLVVSQRMFTE
jgi:hypothetical protein